MPLGKYPNFAACVADYIKSGKSKESASRICGALEARMKQAANNTNVKYEENGRHYIKAFLLDSTKNINNWGVNPESLEDHINSFIGKPLVLTESFNHPMPPDFDRVADTYYDNDNNPHNTVKVDDIVEHWLAYQEDFRVGNIIDITNKGDTYYSIIELTDPQAKEAFRDNEVPLFVSPAIAQLDPYEDPSNITKWTGVHLAIVSDPAYTIKKALVTGQCHESADNHNDNGKCLLQLRQASAVNKDSKQKTLFGCGFCRGRVLAQYAEIVKSWHTKHSVVINKPKTVTNAEDFLNSSIENSDTKLESSELTESNNTQQEVTENTTTEKETTEKALKQPLVKEPKEAGAPEPSDYGKDKKTGKYIPMSADTFGIKMAGMEECVQIFTQNGVTPDQSVQICKLAAKALMENQEQNPQAQGNKPAGSGPGISGQFGSVTDYEKEIAKQEIKIGQLTEELRNYKKGDKTDAQRIAELEETVTKLNSNLKEKELEAYLVTKISDVELRNKKIKRFAELNMTLEDLKDIYDNSNIDPKIVKKTAEVVTPQQSPISKVKLQVASSNSNEDNNTVNEVRERNNRISSLLSSKRYQ